jgi:CubicO group peptidase (beta-lactamase class C family)
MPINAAIADVEAARMRPRRLVPLALVLALSACAAHAPRSYWTGFGHLENVLNWTPEQQLRGYRNIDRIFPTRPIARSPDPFPLAERRDQRLSSVRYTLDGQPYDIPAFMRRNHVVGLLVIHDGAIAVERYGSGNGRHTKWYSFSVAKSVVSMLIGAAVRDGFIRSLDDPVTSYVPLLKGSAYDGVTLRQVMGMTSGVEWNENYADSRSDIAQTGGSALDRLRYLLKRPRVAPPGTRFNYNTEETNLAGAVLRAAIGNNLSTYLEQKVWQPFGMEDDANWLLMSEGGAEPGGCCLSATLRDYGRLGMFALRGGRGRDGRTMLPDGWMAQTTAPSAANANYGQLWWVRPGGAYAAIGIYGQAIYVDPSRSLVVVTHSAWPQATDRVFAAHREALFAAVTAAVDAPR